MNYKEVREKLTKAYSLLREDMLKNGNINIELHKKNMNEVIVLCTESMDFAEVKAIYNKVVKDYYK